MQAIVRFLAAVGAAIFIVLLCELVLHVIIKGFRLAYRGASWLFNKMTNSARIIKDGKYAGRKVYTVGDGVEVIA